MSGTAPTLQERSLPRINQAIRELFEGRSNAVGTVTLRENETTTVVPAPNCGLGSRIFLMATTADAAAEAGGTALHISAVGRGAFTITHANSGSTTRIFFWLAIG